MKNELCTYGQLLLQGSRLIPQELPPHVLELAHEGYRGIVKTKRRLRSKEKLCRSCHGCQAVSEYALPEPMARAFLPSDQRQDCAADILGPLPSGESLLVVVNYFRRCFEVVILRSTSGTKVTEGLKPIFVWLGVPHMPQPSLNKVIQDQQWVSTGL